MALRLSGQTDVVFLYPSLFWKFRDKRNQKKKKIYTVFLPKAANYQQLKLLGLDWSTYALASAYAYVQSSVDETVVQ